MPIDTTDHVTLDWIIAVDLAQGGQDWTALCVLERSVLGERPAEYRIIHMERFRDRAAPRIVPDRVQKIWHGLRQRHVEQITRREGRLGGAPISDPPIRLCVDTTGVGGFGTDGLRRAGFRPTSILIHGGDAASHAPPDVWRVPKRDLAGILATLLGERRLKIAEQLQDSNVLLAELANFKVKISLAGHDSYAAGEGGMWREGSHDDLVLATGIGAWLGEHAKAPKLSAGILEAFGYL